MRYLSLFSGIGGFELGIQQAQNHAECIGYSEIDRYAIQIYERHFQHKNYGNITKIIAEKLPSFEFLCGGFPCQSFSIAGKRGGFADTRGTLFFDIARILATCRPRLLLLENVKGLLSHDTGKTFTTIIGTLDELGYDLQWQVLNSKNFGVPQNRERVFIVGHLRGTPRPKVFPIGNSDENDIKPTKELREQISNMLRTNYSNGKANETHIGEIKQMNQPTHSNDRIYGEEGISPSLNTMQSGRRQPKIIHRDLRSVEDGLSATLRSGGRGGVPSQRILNGLKIRRLTPLECERLQGFPDNWTVGVSDTQRYKCLGNAVTVNVIKFIASRL